MKKIRLLAALAALLPVVPKLALAADSTTLLVTANVVGNCKITGTTPVAFGQLDPAATGNVTASGSVTFWCTKGASWTLSANTGSNPSGGQMRMKGPGASDFIVYSLAFASTTGTGIGANSPVTVNANGTVAQSAFANATVGAYSDSVTVTITP